GGDDVVQALQVGLHDLERVVLREADVLQGRRVEDDVHAAHRKTQAIEIANVAELRRHLAAPLEALVEEEELRLGVIEAAHRLRDRKELPNEKEVRCLDHAETE